MVEGGKKKNRNRNKNKNKAVNSEVPASVEATHEAPPPVTPTPTAAETSSIANGPPTDRPKSAKKKSPSPPAAAPASAPVPAVTEKAPQTEEERQQDLLKNLAQDYQPHPMWAQVKEAEVKFYSNITNGHQSDQSSQKGAPKASSEESDVDLFASDEEPVAKPKLVQPAPKAAPTKAASKKEKKSAHSNKANAEVDNLTQLAGNQDLIQKIQKMENDNKNLQKVCDGLKSLVLKLDERVKQLESGGGAAKPAAAKPAAAAEEDDDVDLFGSDSDEEEDAEKVRIREERLKAYHEKKSKKPALIAKTSVLLDVKPWDDETDMDAMLKACKTIEKEGLVWGASKLVPVGYGIKKLQVMCVVEDDKVSIDELCEQIAEFEDFVQSVDVAAMSKI